MKSLSLTFERPSHLEASASKDAPYQPKTSIVASSESQGAFTVTRSDKGVQLAFDLGCIAEITVSPGDARAIAKALALFLEDQS